MTPDRLRAMLSAPTPEHLAQVDADIRFLQSVRDVLVRLLDTPPGNPEAPATLPLPGRHRTRREQLDSGAASRTKILDVLAVASRPMTVAELTVATSLTADTVKGLVRRMDLITTGSGRRGDQYRYAMRPQTDAA